MSWCAAVGCNNDWKNCKGKNISFHSLPKKENIRKQWITALNRTKLPKKVYVCSEHFEESCFDPTVKLKNEVLGFEKPIKTRLILGSVPTKFSHKSATALRTSSLNRGKKKKTKTNHDREEEMRHKVETQDLMIQDYSLKTQQCELDPPTMELKQGKPTNKTFATVSTGELDSLALNKKNRKHMNQMRWAVGLFKEYLKENNEDDNFESFSTDKLDTSLTGFYVSLRLKEGKIYNRSSYLNIRAAINRFLRSPPNNRMINIMLDREFMVANQVLRAIVRKLRKSGNNITKHRLAILDKDMRKLYSSGVLSNDTPLQLLRKVFIEISIHFGLRCRKKLNELTKKSIIVGQDGKGREYATMGRKKIIYAQPNSTLCPVFSLKKYLSKLNEKCTAFYQRPLKINNPACVSCWYENKSLGISKIAAMMKIISQEAQLSKIYTNNYIRATNAEYNHVEIKTEGKYSANHDGEEEMRHKVETQDLMIQDYSLETQQSEVYSPIMELKQGKPNNKRFATVTTDELDSLALEEANRSKKQMQWAVKIYKDVIDSERSDSRRDDESNLEYFNAESLAEKKSVSSYQIENPFKVEIPDLNQTTESIDKIHNNDSQGDTEFDENSTDSDGSDLIPNYQFEIEYPIKVDIPDSNQTTESIDKIHNNDSQDDTEFDENSTDSDRSDLIPNYQFEIDYPIKVDIPDSNQMTESIDKIQNNESIGKIQNDTWQHDTEFDESTADSERSDPKKYDESNPEYFNAESMADEYSSEKKSAPNYQIEFENFIKVETPDSNQTTESIDKIQNDASPHDTEFDECSTDWNTFLQISDVRSMNYI